MRKDLEDWLRGEARQEPLFVAWDAVAPEAVREVKYPVIPLSLPLSGEERAVEERAEESIMIKEHPAEKGPSAESPVEENVIEENLIEESLVEENSVEESLIEESLIEESPIKESPIEKNSVEETLPENAAAEGLENSTEKSVSEKVVSEASIFEDPLAKLPTDSYSEQLPEKNEKNGDDNHERDDVQIENTPDDGSGGKRGLGFPEWEATRFAQRLRRIQQMRRSSSSYKRSGFRGRQGCFLSLCVLALFFIGTTFAVYRHLQRNSYAFLMDGATALYEQEQYGPAFDAYKQASDRYTNRVEPLLGMAHSAERVGRVEEAIMAYRSSLELLPANAAPSRSGIFYEIGRLYATLKAWDNAQDNFREAVAMDSTNYSAYFALGNALEEQNKPEESIRAYKHALELSPSSDAAQEAITRMSLRLPSVEPKREDLAQKYEHAIQVGKVALELKHYEEASRYFSEALTVRSDDADAWVGFADARANLGDTAGAIKSLERALEWDPDHGDAQSKLAKLKEAQSKKKTPSRPRRSPRSTPRSSSSSKKTGTSARATDTALSKREFFEMGIDHYRKGKYTQAFEAFAACLRFQEGELFPSSSLAGNSGPLWRGFPVKLNVPSDVRLLAESVRLNPVDRHLYLNLSMAGTKMGLDRRAWRTTLNDIHSHALTLAGRGIQSNRN